MNLMMWNIIGHAIDAVKVTWPAVAGFASDKSLTHWLQLKKVVDIQRRGKYIDFLFNDGSRYGCPAACAMSHLVPPS